MEYVELISPYLIYFFPTMAVVCLFLILVVSVMISHNKKLLKMEQSGYVKENKKEKKESKKEETPKVVEEVKEEVTEEVNEMDGFDSSVLGTLSLGDTINNDIDNL